MTRFGQWAALSGGLLMAISLLGAPAHAAGTTLTMEATAYGPSAADNYPYGPTDYFGQPLVAGDIAVDPSVIPLRTCLYVTGYQDPNLPAGGFIGEADDEGGAIKGLHVDLFMNANPTQVANFGIQTVHVTILGPASSTTLSGTAACAAYAGDRGAGGGTGSSAAAAPATGSTPVLVGLTPGMTGAHVYTLQADLALLGFTGVAMTGVYDAATTAAVTTFERTHSLPVGGPTTLAFRNAMLSALRSPAPNNAETASGVSGNASPTAVSAVASERAAIVKLALGEVGRPYVWGGTSPAGFDCSGLVEWVFAREGISLPRLSGQQYRFGTPITKADLEPGDLVFFQTYKPGPSHVGIYIGAYQGIPHAFVAADNPAVGVEVDNLDSAKWQKLFYGAARILPDVPPAGRATTAPATAESAPTTTSLATTTASAATTAGAPGSIDGRRVIKVIHMIATAYGPSLQDNYPYGPVDAFGQPLQSGMVAVDPSVIPLKTYVYVTGYTDPNLPAGGFLGRAMDTGGAIKGDRVDIFMNADAKTVSDFGIEPVTVYVLGN